MKKIRDAIAVLSNGLRELGLVGYALIMVISMLALLMLCIVVVLIFLAFSSTTH